MLKHGLWYLGVEIVMENLNVSSSHFYSCPGSCDDDIKLSVMSPDLGREGLRFILTQFLLCLLA